MDQKAKVFAEEAIRAVGRLDVATARTCISQAFEVDQSIGALADAIYLACSEIEEDNGVGIATWNTLADAVDSADLLAVVESSRS
ncbi:MAG TPA: hypothetical protein VEB69_00935 [Acidimicrobiia bacterium]|nr:hypothetical protein [Acidimicrobiia bacterium]